MTSPAAAPADADRLLKLWEAYRVQEEELKAALQHVDRLVKELEGRGADVVARERVAQDKDQEIQRLQHVIAERDARIRRLEALEEDAKAIQAYKDRIAQVEAALAQEKERLAKLFLLYEEATKGK